MSRTVLSALALLTGLTVALAASGRPSQTEDDRLHVVLPRDAIRAIDAPRFESVQQADRYFADDELVIGVVGQAEQRVYSTWQLDRHEIVNDFFEGRPIAVTW